MRRFAQVDVFSDRPYEGNPLAVVLDGDGLTEAQMQGFARWTNLSGTTFVLPPEPGADADYRVRIFTPTAEMPFAGHPTLGTAQVWLAAGGIPRSGSRIVQQCAAGLVTVRPGRDESPKRLSFLAPPLRRSGPVEDETLDLVVRGLGITRTDVVDHQWVDNGPGALALLLKDPGTVLSLRPDPGILARQKVGVAARYPSAGPGEPQLEVRFFPPGLGMLEDPVTGSFNAGLGQWLTASGYMPPRYLAAQGQLVGRRGRVHVVREGDDVWVGGDVHLAVQGEVDL